MVLLKVIPHGLQHGALRQSPGCVADIQHATQTAGIHVQLRVVNAIARLLLLLQRGEDAGSSRSRLSLVLSAGCGFL